MRAIWSGYTGLCPSPPGLHASGTNAKRWGSQPSSARRGDPHWSSSPKYMNPSGNKVLALRPRGKTIWPCAPRASFLAVCTKHFSCPVARRKGGSQIPLTLRGGSAPTLLPSIVTSPAPNTLRQKSQNKTVRQGDRKLSSRAR